MTGVVTIDVMAVNLNEEWEWNEITGEPYHHPPRSWNSRYRPSAVEMNEVQNQNCTTDDAVKETLHDFMSSNNVSLTTRLPVGHGGAFPGYLRFIRSLNLKKIHVEYVRGGTINISKLDRAIPFTAEPDG